jgi:hypothetical protein
MDEEYFDGPLLLSLSSFFSPPSKYMMLSFIFGGFKLIYLFVIEVYKDVLILVDILLWSL